MRAERFEFLSAYRGPMAALGWKRESDKVFQVMLVEWPASLFAMLKADVLGPKAKAEALKLLAEDAADRQALQAALADPAPRVPYAAARGRSIDIAGRV